MKKHTIELTDDQLRVTVGLFHVGASSLAGDVVAYIKAAEIVESVDDHEKRSEEVQTILVSALDPTGWERVLNQAAAEQRRN